MHQRERRLGRIEGLHRQMQHDGAVFADGIEHHRVLTLGDHLTHDVDTFGLELFEMGQSIHDAWNFNGLEPTYRYAR